MRKTVRKFSDFLKDNTFEDVPPMESYLELCNEFGDDFMCFPEFEYRFYRFHSGEKDDFDSRLDAPLKAFSDLPVEIIGMFVRELWPIDRIQQDTCSIDVLNGRIVLTRLEKGYQISDFHQTVILRNYDYREGILNLFLRMLGNPKSKIKVLGLSIDSGMEDYHWLSKNLSKSLGNERIRVRKLVFDGNLLLPFLHLLEPGALRTLLIYRSLEIQQGLYTELADTEQWRQARRVEIPSRRLNGLFKPDQIPYFAHFHWFDVRLSGMAVTELMEVVKTLKNSENLKKCILRGELQFTINDYATASNKMPQNNFVLREPIEGTLDRELELRQNDISEDGSVLLTMPKVVMNEVVENLDFKEILKLRKVCRDLRNFVDQNADLHLYGLKICDFDNETQLSVSENGKTEEFCYKKRRNGCEIVQLEQGIEKKRFVKKGNYLDLVFHDLAVILRLQKSALELFEVEFNIYTVSPPEFSSKLHEIMAPRLLKTIRFYTTVSQSSDVMCCLPYLHTGSLESIKIQCTQKIHQLGRNEQKYLNLKEGIVELEQWKGAERIGIYGFLVAKEELEYFRHATVIDVTLEHVGSEDLVEWKENLLRHAHLQQVTLHCCSSDNENFSDLFGPIDISARLIHRPFGKCCFKTSKSEEIIEVSWWTTSFFRLERKIFDKNDNYDLIHEIPV
ncbi:hypothetical protein CAEBREN_29144 [Caenorhabditis brenneri]|uniref:F-box domain-containing protein n=1 Tax=Caenorhabditis brenneri TaxID=135651 RepID=G0MVS5_CAEBE|nr:hypothetical protein CAEBREN_29144 [Caenorhabditis brenneri]